ncbi:hypothetical protein PsorP6_019039 [Peronosclerospora sorghi]|nr:hypothetical protein PsorP6_019038 [Peronosclerospora sorghi]KAI9895712.1 hypothetical protein PsorP6_019039 [Peronosclerospora sorghi]
MKRDLETTQENYERESQLHVAEVSKLSACRREMDRNIEYQDPLNGKEEQVELELLQKRLEEVLEEKTALAEQNLLLNSQLEHSAAQSSS